MYHHIRGKVSELSPTRAVLEAGGVGYELTVPLSTYESLKAAGEDGPALLYTFLYVREDQMRLFGFATPAERNCFAIILSVSGIGPTTAVSLLSGLSVDEIQQAVSDGAARQLQRIKGIGRKTAERLVVELGGRLPEDLSGQPAGPEDRTGEELELALQSLGYTPAQAGSAAREARRVAPEAPLEELVKLALRTSEGMR